MIDTGEYIDTFQTNHVEAYLTTDCYVDSSAIFASTAPYININDFEIVFLNGEFPRSGTVPILEIYSQPADSFRDHAVVRFHYWNGEYFIKNRDRDSVYIYTKRNQTVIEIKNAWFFNRYKFVDTVLINGTFYLPKVIGGL